VIFRGTCFIICCVAIIASGCRDTKRSTPEAVISAFSFAAQSTKEQDIQPYVVDVHTVLVDEQAKLIKAAILSPSSSSNEVLLLFSFAAPNSTKVGSVVVSNDIAFVDWKISLEKSFEFGPRTINAGESLEFNSRLKHSDGVWLLERL
jgi:hypothetical protein